MVHFVFGCLLLFLLGIDDQSCDELEAPFTPRQTALLGEMVATQMGGRTVELLVTS